MITMTVFESEGAVSIHRAVAFKSSEDGGDIYVATVRAGGIELDIHFETLENLTAFVSPHKEVEDRRWKAK